MEYTVLGLPLDIALSKVKEFGYQPRVIRYEPLREIEGAVDWRIVKERYVEGTVELVASPFKTDLN